MDKPRVLYILRDFPQITQTYIKNEIEAVDGQFDIRVVALNPPDIAYQTRVPYAYVSGPAHFLEAIKTFRPSVIHTHYLTSVGLVSRLCRQTGIPFTVRAHSSDCLRSVEGNRYIRSGRNRGARAALDDSESIWTSLRRAYKRMRTPRARLHAIAPLINDDLCLGVLTFPFTRPILEGAGIRGDRIRDCFPVLPFERFHSRAPNGSDIMGLGAHTQKKRHRDFIRLARDMSGLVFNLYAIGYRIENLHQLNRSMGSPARIVPPIQPDEMPAEYKKHRWLVYTACPKRASVGWPLAIAEAQAAGVGVCMANVRPDLREYVGDAGFMFDSPADVQRIVAGPFPDELRERGFELARRSDIGRHKVLLTELWQRAAAGSPAGGRPIAPG